MKLDEIINRSFDILNFDKKELLSNRLTVNNLKKIIAVFYVANKYYCVNDIAKILKRHRTTMYYYIKLLRPNVQFFLFQDNIEKIEKTLNL